MSTPPAPDSSNGATTLRRTVGPWQVMLYGVGGMLGAGIYALIGKVAGVMGSMVWLAFGVAMIAALLTGFTYACVGCRYPKAAGAAYVTQHAFRLPWLSYVVGIAVMMSGLTSMATGAQAIVENLGGGLNMALPVKPVAICLVAFLGLVIFAGIQQSMWMNMVCTVIEVSGLLFIIAVGVKFWGTVSYTELPNSPGSAEPAQISDLLTHHGTGMVLMLALQGAVLTFFAFIGFEDILNVSEEVVEPERNVPRGLIGAMLISTCIYMAVAVTAVSVIPWQVLANSKAPLLDVARTAAPWFKNINLVFLVITVIAIGNTALLNYLMGSRLLFGMSRQGLMPSFLSRLNSRTRTPHFAILTLLAIVSALIIAGGVKQLAESTVLLLLMVFTIVNVALIVLKRRPGEPRGRFEVPMIVPILGALVCIAMLAVRGYAAVTSADRSLHVAPLVSAAIVGVSLLLYFVLKPKSAVAEEA
jgi:APA family basic amino acid/polyamine antiporter